MSNYDTANGRTHSTPAAEIVQTPGLIGRTGPAGYGNGALSSYVASPESGDGGGAGGGGAGFSRYIHALRRRWLISLVLALPLAAGAAYGAWALQPQMYTATAVLQIKSAEDNLVFVTADQSKGMSNTFDSFKRGQRVMLRQRYLIERALAPPKHADLLKLPVIRRESPDEVGWLEKNLSVVYPEDSDIMYVSLTADDPNGLHDIVNSIVDEYYDEVVRSERRRKLDRLNNLDKARKDADTELRKKRNEFKQLVERVGPSDKGALTTVQQAAVQEYSTFIQLLTKVKFDLIQAETELKHREQLQADLLSKHGGETPNGEDDDDSFSEGELAVALQADSLTRAIESEQQSIVLKIEAIKSRLSPDKASGAVKDETRRLELITAKLEARKAQVRAELAERLRRSGEEEIEQLKQHTAHLKMQFKELEEHAKALDSKAKAAGKTSIDVEMLQSEIDAHVLIANTLLAEYGKTKVELNPTNMQNDASSDEAGARIKILNPALRARPADSKTRLTTTIGVSGMSFLLPFVLFIFLDASKNRISTGAEVTQAVGLSVIGAVPILPQRVMRRLNGPSENDKYWRTLLSESVDSIAAVLLKGTQPGGSRVIMVSSANAGEGKTTLAAHLAVSLAGAGRHPVLVDFDLRRPALHRVFGVSLQPGVNEILRDGHDFEAALQATQIPNLMMLSAGRTSKLGLAGLVSADLQSLFTRLRSDFDFVVVDACPILPVVDTRLIGQHVDAVLLSVLRDVSRAPKLRAACDLLDMFGIPMLGVVVTGSSEELYKDARYEPLSEAQAV